MEACSQRFFLHVLYGVDVLRYVRIVCPEVWETQEERYDVSSFEAPSLIREEIEQVKGSEYLVERLNVLAASGPRVFALSGLDDALIDKLGCLFLFVCVVFSFEECDVCIIGGKRVEYAVKGGLMVLFVGFVSKGNTGNAAGVCDHAVNGEASIQQGIAEEDHVVVSGISFNGRECFQIFLEYEENIGDGQHA